MTMFTLFCMFLGLVQFQPNAISYHTIPLCNFVHVAHLDLDSQAEFKAALERSLSTRQPGREGVNNPFFERNTPRSKSLGRPGLKGTQYG